MLVRDKHQLHTEVRKILSNMEKSPITSHQEEIDKTYVDLHRLYSSIFIDRYQLQIKGTKRYPSLILRKITIFTPFHHRKGLFLFPAVLKEYTIQPLLPNKNYEYFSDNITCNKKRNQRYADLHHFYPSISKRQVSTQTKETKRYLYPHFEKLSSSYIPQSKKTGSFPAVARKIYYTAIMTQ